MAVFGTHPYKRSSGLARGFPTATHKGRTDAGGDRAPADESVSSAAVAGAPGCRLLQVPPSDSAAAPGPTPRRATADRPYRRPSGVGEMPAGRCACGPRRCRAALAWCRCAAPPAGARARRRISPPAPGFASSGSRSPLGLWRPRATYRRLEIFVRQAASGRLRGCSGRRASAANVPVGGHVVGAR
jgi:hypothetical protein